MEVELIPFVTLKEVVHLVGHWQGSTAESQTQTVLSHALLLSKLAANTAAIIATISKPAAIEANNRMPFPPRERALKKSTIKVVNMSKVLIIF